MVKQSSFMLAFFVIALLAISFASANLEIINTSSIQQTVTQGQTAEFKFKVNNTDPSESLFVSFSNITTGDVKVSIPISQLISNLSGELSVKVDTTYWTTEGNGYQIKLTASNESSISDDITFYLTVTESIEKTICGLKYAPNNISFDDIEDNEAGNDNEWEWMPSNKISLTINNIENKVDDDEKFDISLLFYKGTTKISGSKIASNDDNLKIDNLKIKGEDDENANFEFNVASDAKEEDYDMYVKVEGKYGCYVEKLGEQVSISTEDGDYSIVSDVIGPVSTSCGENVDLTVTVLNIGDDDAERVKVILYNKELGVNMFKEIDNLDKGDEAITSFSFTVPQNAVEKNYKFSLYTQFDYDDRKDNYGEYSDNEYDYIYVLSLSGNCIDPTKPLITAKLDSSAMVGEDLVISVTFKNNGNTSVSAIIAPEDFESWAGLVSVEPATITVGRAESKTVYITFKPTKEGTQTFNLNAIYNGKSMDQPVTLSIEANPSLMNSLKEQLGSTGAYLALGIAILIALIVLVIIIKLVIWLVRKH